MSLENLLKSKILKGSFRIAKPFLLLGSYVVLHEYLHGGTALALGGGI